MPNHHKSLSINKMENMISILYGFHNESWYSYQYFLKLAITELDQIEWDVYFQNKV